MQLNWWISAGECLVVARQHCIAPGCPAVPFPSPLLRPIGPLCTPATRLIVLGTISYISASGQTLPGLCLFLPSFDAKILYPTLRNYLRNLPAHNPPSPACATRRTLQLAASRGQVCHFWFRQWRYVQTKWPLCDWPVVGAVVRWLILIPVFFVPDNRQGCTIRSLVNSSGLDYHADVNQLSVPLVLLSKEARWLLIGRGRQRVRWCIHPGCPGGGKWGCVVRRGRSCRVCWGRPVSRRSSWVSRCGES